MPLPQRSRFPLPFTGLCPGFGGKLKKARKARSLTQQVLADKVGIARQSLWAIEFGKAVPRPDTFDALMLELDLELADVLSVDPTHDVRPRFNEPAGLDRRLDLGRSLRLGRIKEGLTLAAVAGKCGLSGPQLSRIERGQASRSKTFEDHPDYAGLDKEDRPIRFRLPELERLRLLS